MTREMFLAFWAGGVVAVTLEIWLEWESGSPFFAVARARPWAFGVFLAACVLCWPAGFLLKVELQRRTRREHEEEAAEFERIEATRQPVGVYCPATKGECEYPCVGSTCVLFEAQWSQLDKAPQQWWICPDCKHKQPVPAASSALVSRVHWFCEGCLRPLDAPASRIDCDFDD